jgi:L-glyceraldehyde reductase
LKVRVSNGLVAELFLTLFLDFELPQDVFDQITAMDRNTRYNFPARWGVDVFGEVSDESLEKSVQEWLEAQRKLKAA